MSEFFSLSLSLTNDVDFNLECHPLRHLIPININSLKYTAESQNLRNLRKQSCISFEPKDKSLAPNADMALGFYYIKTPRKTFPYLHGYLIPLLLLDEIAFTIFFKIKSPWL